MPSLLALDRVLTRPTREHLGRYRLLGRLGAGGMAEVFVARSGDLPGLQSLVAIKRILPHLAEDEALVSLFRREAQISLRLRHRAIARVIEVGRVSTSWFLAMELVPGESLAHVLRAEREGAIAVDPRICAWVGAEIASALHHAHTLRDGGTLQPVIHRDVSPQNLLLGFDGAAKLIDFGVARYAHLSDATRTGTVRGKLAYASPEQLAARPLDGRSDLFSLAAVLYEWLSGSPLFARESDAATVQAVLSAPVLPVDRAPDLSAVLTRALARDAGQRFTDGVSFAEALLAAVGGPLSTPERLVASHLQSLFADREARWQAIVSERTITEIGRDSRSHEGPHTIVSHAAILPIVSPNLRTPSGPRRWRRTLALAAGIGLTGLTIGVLRRPAIHADGPSTSVASAGVLQDTPLVRPPSPPVGVEQPAPAAVAFGVPATRQSHPTSRVRAKVPRARHRTVTPKATRAIVEELEPSPYAKR